MPSRGRKAWILGVGWIVLAACRGRPKATTLLMVNGLPETPQRRSRFRSKNRRLARTANASKGADSSSSVGAVVPSTTDPTAIATMTDNPFEQAHILRTMQRHRRLQLYVKALQKVALFNIALGILGLDIDALFWQLKLPRLCWEACIYVIAKDIERGLTLQHEHHGVSPQHSAAVGGGGLLHILLALMLLSTALTDIFVWGPIMASFTSFQSCTNSGRWWSFVPGMLRNAESSSVCETDYLQGMWGLTKTFQSIFGGLFYLTASLVLWNAYAAMNQSEQMDQKVAALNQYQKCNGVTNVNLVL